VDILAADGEQNGFIQAIEAVCECRLILVVVLHVFFLPIVEKALTPLRPLGTIVTRER
jgi:hypothetical protein